MKTYYSKLDKIIELIEKIMDHNQNSYSFPDKMYPIKSHDNNTVVLDNKKSPSLEGVHYTKIGVMWTLNHDIIPPNLYKLLIKT